MLLADRRWRWYLYGIGYLSGRAWPDRVEPGGCGDTDCCFLSVGV